jgi:hypothetical protein
MQMECALCPGGNGLLEHHDAVAGLSAQQFERHRPARRYRVLSWQYTLPCASIVNSSTFLSKSKLVVRSSLDSDERRPNYTIMLKASRVWVRSEESVS